MERIHKIWSHPLYQQEFRFLQLAEKERIFCNHTMEHFLDVARISWIHILEDHADVSQVLVYAAALLHDIGRYRQITDGTPHEEAGAILAEQIMLDCGFSSTEISTVCHAIRQHRLHPSDSQNEEATLADPASSGELLSRYIFQADKQSRNCFCCPASEECNWANEKRNLQIKI